MDREGALLSLKVAEGDRRSFGTDDAEAIARFGAEHARFEAALDYFDDNEMLDEGMRLSTALHIYWMEHGHLSGGRKRLTGFLEKTKAAPTIARVAALNAAGRLAFRQGDNDVARSLLKEGLDLARSLGDRDGEAWALSILSRVSLRDHDFTLVRERAQASADIFVELGDEEASWSPRHVLAYVTMMEGDLPKAKKMFLDSVDLARSVGKESLAAGEYQNVGIVNTRLGDYDAALDNFRECFDIAIKDQDMYLMPYAYLGLAAVAAGRADCERAGLLLGITDRILASTEMVLDPGDQPDYENVVALCSDALGEEGFAGVCAEGRGMAPIDAEAFARGSFT